MKSTKIMIWQIDRNKAAEKMFRDYDFVRDNLGGVDLRDYRKEFEGSVGTHDLDAIYMIFNSEARPERYRGRSLSIGDIVVVIGRWPRQKYRYWYVNSAGFRELTWADKGEVGSLKMK
ncbi:MAG: hypothetical protein IJV00_02695 [Clostridia bacterium]|nr:hypothetical protein [Clostridia bacterium]